MGHMINEAPFGTKRPAQLGTLSQYQSPPPSKSRQRAGFHSREYVTLD